MREAKLALYFIVLAATVAWSQRAPVPEPDQAAQAPAFRAPHSSKEDLAVPMCPVTFNDSLETDGIAVLPRDKGAVTPPKPTHMSEAMFSDEARRQGRSLGISEFKNTISMVVGVDGLPRNFCLVQSAGYGLDAKAKEAAQQYRFAPATKDGQPILVRITVVMTFKLY
jgi:TonB family protein